jgi:aspartate/methionine/tyrosine aminotransferase
VRPRILERTRAIIQSNWRVLADWYVTMGGEFTSRAPDAGAISYARYRSDANSSVFAERLRRDFDVLVVPGDQFEMDRFIRFGFGLPRTDLEAALDRVATAFRTNR